MDRKKIIISALFLVVIILAVGFFIVQTNKEEKDVSDLSNSAEIENASVPTPDVSPSINPVKDVLPTSNPIEKTNPFKDEYQNPFQ